MAGIYKRVASHDDRAELTAGWVLSCLRTTASIVSNARGRFLPICVEINGLRESLPKTRVNLPL